MILTDPEKFAHAEDIELGIKIKYDEEAKTVTIMDTGIGMTREELVKNLGTVARSGTGKFVEHLKETGDADEAMSQIGQFGVGFYSSFLVAEKVVVRSKHPLDPVQHIWVGQNGANDFIVYPDPEGNTIERGTEITLHLKESAEEFCDSERVKEVATHYSEFAIYPISLESPMEIQVEDENPLELEKKLEEELAPKENEDDLEVSEEEDTDEEEEEEAAKPMKTITVRQYNRLNQNKAIWTREKEEITDDEYQSFFQVLTKEEDKNATTWSHFKAEGKINFKALLYLPRDYPFEMQYGQLGAPEGAMRLYIRKVLIGDDMDLFPKWLGFIRGVVDSDDLPLNVNRETLQDDKILQVIKKKLMRKGIDLIRTFEKESEDLLEQQIADGTAEDWHPSDEEKGRWTDKSEERWGAEVSDAEKKKMRRPTSEYMKWYMKFSPNIKLGIVEDDANRNKLVKLLRYETSKSNGRKISLQQYVDQMKDWQQNIYVIGGQSIKEIEASPFLEQFFEKDIEVLYLTEPSDEYVFQHIKGYDAYKIMHASSEQASLSDDDEETIKRRYHYYHMKYTAVTKWLRKLFTGTGIYRVQVTKKYLSSKTAAIITSGTLGTSANFDRILRAQAFLSADDPTTHKASRVFEINPRHKLMDVLAAAIPEDWDKKKKKKKEGEEDEDHKEFEAPQDIIDLAWLMHDMASVAGGYAIADPWHHNALIQKNLAKLIGIEDMGLSAEYDPWHGIAKPGEGGGQEPPPEEQNLDEAPPAEESTPQEDTPDEL
jgi:heat shock protein beta